MGRRNVTEADVDRAPVIRVSCGGQQRNRERVFRQHDVALVGRGSKGDWREKPDKSAFLNERRSLEVFCRANINDLIVMNDGATVKSVGVVAKGYEHREEFGDVQGWDMQHCLRVRWVPRMPDDAPRIRGPRASCRRLLGGNAEVAAWARNVVKEALREGVLDNPLAELPPRPEPLPMEQIPDCVSDIVARARRLAEAVDERNWVDLPSEHETVALLVVPFLLAVGWTPVQLALEWRRIDVAVFGSSAREESDCRLLIEAKRFNSGFTWAQSQAFRYAETQHLDVPIVTTDGCDWYLYENRHDENPTRAYLPKPNRSAAEFFERFGRIGTPDSSWPS